MFLFKVRINHTLMISRFITYNDFDGNIVSVYFAINDEFSYPDSDGQFLQQTLMLHLICTIIYLNTL